MLAESLAKKSQQMPQLALSLIVNVPKPSIDALTMEASVPNNNQQILCFVTLQIPLGTLLCTAFLLYKNCYKHPEVFLQQA